MQPLVLLYCMSSSCVHTPQRMWEFAIGLILLKLRPGSLALVAAFGLVDSCAQVLAGPFIGAYVDRHALTFPKPVTSCQYECEHACMQCNAGSTF